MAYSRLVIALRQGCDEYTKDVRGSLGRCIIECRNGVGRLILQAQGLRSECDYRVCILTKDAYAEANRPLYVGGSGRGELKWEFKPESIGISVSDIKACAVLVRDKAPLIGFVDGEYNWQSCLMAKSTEQVRAASNSEYEQEKEKENEYKNEDITLIYPEKEKLICIINELDEDINEIREYSKIGHENNINALFAKDGIKPFGDDGITWVRGNIKELSLIKALWKYIDNPFVIKGCRDYKHIILGRDSDSCFYLGIPCKYDSDYKLEAMVQGFTQFKAEGNKSLNKGDFCYCILKC